MRLVDADKLKEDMIRGCRRIGKEMGVVLPTSAFVNIIDNAPTAEPEKIYLAKINFDKEQLQEIVNKAKTEILASAERPQGEWISVSERLPNCNGVYNVTRIIDGIAISDSCYFDGQNTWHCDIGVNHGRPYLDDIIAWQELPEPYKMDGEEADNEIN